MPPKTVQPSNTYPLNTSYRDTSSSTSWHTTRTEGPAANLHHDMNPRIGSVQDNMSNQNYGFTDTSGLQRSDGLPPTGTERLYQSTSMGSRRWVKSPKPHDNGYLPEAIQKMPAQNYTRVPESAPGIWTSLYNQSNENERRMPAVALSYNDDTRAAVSQLISSQGSIKDRQQHNPNNGHLLVSRTEPKVAEPEDGQGSLAIKRFLLESPRTDPSGMGRGLSSSMLGDQGKRSMPPRGKARTNGPFQEESSSEGSGSPVRKMIILYRPPEGRSDRVTRFHSRPGTSVNQLLSATQRTSFPQPYPAPPVSQSQKNHRQAESEMSRRLDADHQRNISFQRMSRIPPVSVVRRIRKRIDGLQADNRAKTRLTLPELETWDETGQFRMPGTGIITNPFYKEPTAPTTAAANVPAPAPTAMMYTTPYPSVMPPPILPNMSTTTSNNFVQPRKLTPLEVREMYKRNERLMKEAVVESIQRDKASLAACAPDEDLTRKMAEMSDYAMREERENAARKQAYETKQRLLFKKMPKPLKTPLPSAGIAKQRAKKVGKAKSRLEPTRSAPSQVNSTSSRSTRPKPKAAAKAQYTDEQVAGFRPEPIDHKIYTWRTEKNYPWSDILFLVETHGGAAKTQADVIAIHDIMAAKYARGDLRTCKGVSSATHTPAAAINQANPGPADFQARNPAVEVNQANVQPTGDQASGQAAATTQQQAQSAGAQATQPPDAATQTNALPAGDQTAASEAATTQPYPQAAGASPAVHLPTTPSTTISRAPARGGRKPRGSTAVQQAANALLLQNSDMIQKEELLVRLREETDRRETAERNVVEQAQAMKKFQQQMEEKQKEAKKKLDEEQKSIKQKTEEENKKAKEDNEEEVKRLKKEMKEKEKQHKQDLEEVRNKSKQALIDQKQKSSMEIRNAQLAAAAKSRENKGGRATGTGFSFGKNNTGNEEADEPQPANKPRSRVKSIKTAARPVVDIFSDRYNDTAGKTVIDNDFLSKNWDELFAEDRDADEPEAEEPSPEQILEDDLNFFKYQVYRKTWSGDDEPEDEDAQVVICGDHYSLSKANAAAAAEIFLRNGQDSIFVAPNREYHIHSAPPDDDGMAQIHVEVPDGHIRVWVQRSLVSRYVGKPLPTFDPTAFHKRHQYIVKEETREAYADPASPPTEAADVSLYSFLTLANSCAADRLVARTFHTATSRIEEVKARMSEARYDLNDTLDELKDKGECFCEQRANKKGQVVKLFVTKMEMKGPRN